MPRPNHLFNALLTRLREQISLCVSTGQPLPSQRALADMHGCGQASVHRALKLLAKEGLVRAEASERWVRRGGSRVDLPAIGLRVGLITRRARHTWEQFPIYPALLKEAARRGIDVVEVPFELWPRITPRRSRVDLRQVPWNTFDVGLLVETEDSATLSDPLLRRQRVIAVDQDATLYGIDSVVFNNRLAGELAAQHLFELGHRRAAVTDEVNAPGWPCDLAWTERRHGFESRFGHLGGAIAPEFRLEVARWGRSEEMETAARIVANWRQMASVSRPTALFAFGHDYAAQTIPKLQKEGLRIPQDFSIVGVTWDDHVPVEGLGLMTIVRADLQALVSRALDACVDLRGKGTPFNEDGLTMRRQPILNVAPVALIPGNTSAPAPKSGRR